MESLTKNNINKKDIVLSSKVNLARNLDKVPFPNKLDDSKGKELVQTMLDSLEVDYNDKRFNIHKLWNESEEFMNSYLENHYINNALIKNKNKSAFIFNNKNKSTIMLNEENHIRIQCIVNGFDLKEAYRNADIIDNFIESKNTYAFSEQLGYLTAITTNLGTAMKAYVMIHLPCLTIKNEITSLLKGLNKVGMTIKGVYGNGVKSYGNIYLICNQVSLGITEEDIINNLEAVVREIILQEKNARLNIMKVTEYETKDKIYRAIGVLQNSYIMELKECLNLISYVRLGIECSFIDNIEVKELNKLLLDIQPGTLQQSLKRKLSSKEIDIERAKILRKIFNN